MRNDNQNYIIQKARQPIYKEGDSTTYQVLDAPRVGTRVVWMHGGGACAVLLPFPVSTRSVVEPDGDYV